MSNYNSDEILARLAKILKLLNENKELSIKELTKKMGTSFNEKTIERDLTERLISFPVEREKMKWKLHDGFRFENYKFIEDAILQDMIEKMMKSGGPNFYSKGKKFLNPQNLINLPFDLQDIIIQPKEVQKSESSNKDLMLSRIDEIEDGNDKLIESPLKIKSYLDKYLAAHLKRRDDSKFYLCVVSNDQYIVMNKDVDFVHMYHSVKDLIEDGWVISKELFIKHYSS